MAQDATDALFETLGLPPRALPDGIATLLRSYRLQRQSAPGTRALERGWKAATALAPAVVYDLCMSEAVDVAQPVRAEYPIRLGELVFALRHEKALLRRRPHRAANAPQLVRPR